MDAPFLGTAITTDNGRADIASRPAQYTGIPTRQGAAATFEEDRTMNGEMANKSCTSQIDRGVFGNILNIPDDVLRMIEVVAQATGWEDEIVSGGTDFEEGIPVINTYGYDMSRNFAVFQFSRNRLSGQCLLSEEVDCVVGIDEAGQVFGYNLPGPDIVLSENSGLLCMSPEDVVDWALDWVEKHDAKRVDARELRELISHPTKVSMLMGIEEEGDSCEEG